MNRLTVKQRTSAIACLVEGNSQRATCRMTGLAKKTVSRLAVELGEACERFADNAMRDLPCTRIQCDEIWSFCYSKQKNVPKHLRGSGAGDVWTWVAIDPDTKLIPAWYIGDRTASSGYAFMRNVAKRLKNRVQLSTDGHRAYLIAVKAAFHLAHVDFGMLRKIYGENTLEGKYSPGACIGTERTVISGAITEAEICTSHAERQNLTMRMQMRRFTRLTNAFSKKLENHRLACALHFVHYNFCRIHSSLRITPAMAAGLSERVWEIADLVGLLTAEEMALAA
jgi:IS1 family transposase